MVQAGGGICSQDGAYLELRMNKKEPKNTPGYLGELSAQRGTKERQRDGQQLLGIPLKIEYRAREMA